MDVSDLLTLVLVLLGVLALLGVAVIGFVMCGACLLYTSPSPRDRS